MARRIVGLNAEAAARIKPPPEVTKPTRTRRRVIADNSRVPEDQRYVRLSALEEREDDDHEAFIAGLRAGRAAAAAAAVRGVPEPGRILSSATLSRRLRDAAAPLTRYAQFVDNRPIHRAIVDIEADLVRLLDAGEPASPYGANPRALGNRSGRLLPEHRRLVAEYHDTIDRLQAELTAAREYAPRRLRFDRTISTLPDAHAVPWSEEYQTLSEFPADRPRGHRRVIPGGARTSSDRIDWLPR